MNKSVVQAVVDAGIVDPDAMRQLQRWLQPGLEVSLEANEDLIVSAAGIAQMILEAISDGDAVELRSTDLDIVHEYLKSSKRARLHVPNPEPGGRDTIGISVEYCLTKMGEVVIPWTSESINDTLLDPLTYLKPVGEDRIYFADVRELFYGDHKAFMVCVPARNQ